MGRGSGGGQVWHTGRVPSFMLIPGLLSDARVWAPLARALAARGPVVDVDISGMTSIPDAAAAALASTEGPLVVVGHSLGGRVAFEVARQGGDRVVGLVAADTGHDGARVDEVPLRLARIEQAHADLSALVDAWLPPMLAHARRDSGLAQDLRAMALGVGAEAHERQIRSLIERPDAGDYLGGFSCPALFLVGSEDAWSPPEQHRVMAGLVDHAEVVVVEGAGHFLPVEAPDEVIRAVESWLDRASIA